MKVKLIWLGKPLRFGPWPMAGWGEWTRAFDLGPWRFLYGWQSVVERERKIARMGAFR